MEQIYNRKWNTIVNDEGETLIYDKEYKFRYDADGCCCTIYKNEKVIGEVFMENFDDIDKHKDIEKVAFMLWFNPPKKIQPLTGDMPASFFFEDDYYVPEFGKKDA